MHEFAAEPLVEHPLDRQLDNRALWIGFVKTVLDVRQLGEG
jgi:hypothetical protein